VVIIAFLGFFTSRASSRDRAETPESLPVYPEARQCELGCLVGR